MGIQNSGKWNFLACFIRKGLNKRKFLSITTQPFLSNRVFSTVYLNFWWFVNIFWTYGLKPYFYSPFLPPQVGRREWFLVTKKKKIVWVKSVCYVSDVLWKAWWKQSFLTSHCPLNALLFIQNNSSMTHKKYICYFIYYLPDMLLATTVGSQLSTQFLKVRPGKRTRRLGSAWWLGT